MQTAELDHHALRALLEWQVELGATDAICETPVNRYEVPAAAPRPAVAAAPAAAPEAAAPAVPEAPDPVELARAAAAQAGDLEALRAAIADFDLCELKRGARSTVFADGNPAARLMVIGEAPGREEDREGRPFVGRAGQMLDRMLGAIGMGRAHPGAMAAVYITNVMPWRPPQNRDPTAEEIAMMMPFVARHVQLVDPEVLILMGNISCSALLGRKGITRLRGAWTEALGRPALPMFHPAYLLRNPAAKREAWADLLMLQARLKETA
jgi:DNA polymerase